MRLRDEDVCRLLPPDAVALLRAAAEVSTAGNRLGRQIAIEDATAWIRMRYPNFFART